MYVTITINGVAAAYESSHSMESARAAAVRYRQVMGSGSHIVIRVVDKQEWCRWYAGSL